MFSFRWSSRSLDSFSMSFFLLLIACSMSASSTLALNFISLTFAIKLSMAFVTASALSVTLFKFSLASCKEPVAVSDLFCQSQAIASILVGLEAVGQLVRSLVRFEILVNRILERSETISEVLLLPIGIVSMLFVEHSVICHILASCEVCTCDYHHSATMRP